ncbi:MAG: hypothetical protein HC887_03100 [Desulfobacteraceae bacterium]|nr:hypothetical protein [Desulfobacteraceae bacterium]
MDSEEETPAKTSSAKAVSGAKKPAKISEDKTEVFDLDLDLDEDTAATSIEFDEEETPVSEEKPESFDLDLDMEAETPPAAAKKSEPRKEEEFEFDMEDSEKKAKESPEEFGFNFDGEHDEELSGGSFSAGDVALKEKPVAEPSASFDMGMPDAEEKTDIEAAEEPSSEDKKPIQKKKFKWQTALAAGAAVLVIVSGYFASQFFDLSKIPVVGGMLATKPGVVVPLENSIKGSFVQNNTAGTLFVISGEVRNEFSKPRDGIEVVGKTFIPLAKSLPKQKRFLQEIY